MAIITSCDIVQCTHSNIKAATSIKNNTEAIEIFPIMSFYVRMHATN